MVPILQQYLENTFDLWDPLHNKNCFRILNELREYLSLRSNAMQNILDTLEELIESSLNKTLLAIPKAILRGVNDENFEHRERKQRSIGKLLILMEEILKWKKYFPSGLIQKWVLKKLLEPICIAIECSRDLDFDLILYEKVLIVNSCQYYSKTFVRQVTIQPLKI